MCTTAALACPGAIDAAFEIMPHAVAASCCRRRQCSSCFPSTLAAALGWYGVCRCRGVSLSSRRLTTGLQPGFYVRVCVRVFAVCGVCVCVRACVRARSLRVPACARRFRRRFAVLRDVGVAGHGTGPLHGSTRFGRAAVLFAALCPAPSRPAPCPLFVCCYALPPVFTRWVFFSVVSLPVLVGARPPPPGSGASG